MDPVFELRCLLLFFKAFLGLSLGGTLFHGYFFAFHLLNIVNNNQLLGGVIKAVTQNGKPWEINKVAALVQIFKACFLEFKCAWFYSILFAT